MFPSTITHTIHFPLHSDVGFVSVLRFNIRFNAFEPSKDLQSFTSVVFSLKKCHKSLWLFRFAIVTCMRRHLSSMSSYRTWNCSEINNKFNKISGDFNKISAKKCVSPLECNISTNLNAVWAVLFNMNWTFCNQNVEHVWILFKSLSEVKSLFFLVSDIKCY